MSNGDQNNSEKLQSIEDVALQDLAKEVDGFKTEIKEVRNENRNIIIGVVVAFLLIVVAVSVEIIIYHTSNNSESIELYKKYKEENTTLKHEIHKLEIQILETENKWNMKLLGVNSPNEPETTK